MPYYVCHKCGLTRRREPMKPEGSLPPDLGHCQCHGQTTFQYEETPRRRDEAIVIGVQHFLRVVELYIQQEREAYYYLKLVQQYSKVLSYKAVYKVVINE